MTISWQSIKILIINCVTVGLMTFTAFALPQDPEVVEGSAVITHPDERSMHIQASDKAIINYSSFSIMENETVIMQLPSVDSAILNRVLGTEYSQLLGTLQSNGLVILVNENGIYVGPNANLQAAGLALSTRDITNENFLNANYVFKRLSKEELDMLLVNHGNITISNKGFAALIAGAIENNGNIIAQAGHIALAAGDAVKLELSANRLISVAILEKQANDVVDFQGNKVLDQIKNTGRLEAATVILKAESLPDIFEKAINLEGYVKATKLETGEGGVVRITADNEVRLAAAVEADRTQVDAPSLSIEEQYDLYITSSKQEDSYITLETSDNKRISYLGTANVSITAPAIDQDPAVLIQAASLKLISDRFGTHASPLRLQAQDIHIKSLSMPLEILQSQGLGSTIMITGPPEQGLLFFEYNRDANLTLEASKVSLVGSDPISLYGNIQFVNFECTVPDKEIYFEAGKTYTFKGTTRIEGVPDGAEEYLIKLRSQTPGEQYSLKVEDSYKIDYVNISDANAVNHLFIPVGVDLGNNTNLEVDPVWDGGSPTSEDWSEGANWVGDSAPLSTDAVTFNATSHKNCTIDGLVTVKTLTISGYNGIITQAAGANLTITGTGALYTQSSGTFTGGAANMTVNGTFTVSGGAFTAPSGTMAITGAVNLTGGTFNHNNGTVEFLGNAAHTITTAGAVFNNVTFNKTAGSAISITLSDSMTIAGNLVLKNDYSTNLAVVGATSTYPVITVSGNVEFPATTAVGNITLGSATAGLQPTLVFAGNLSILDGADAILYAHVTLSGSATQQINAVTGSIIDNGTWKLNKASGDITLNSDITIGGNFEVIANNGIFTANGYALTIGGNYTQSSGTVTAPSIMSVTGTFTLSGGTISVSSALTITGNYSQTAGTFNGNASTVNMNGSFTVSGGTFNAPSGALNVVGVINLTGATFNPGAGTVVFLGNTTHAITTGGSAFNNVIFNRTAAGTAAYTLTINGSFNVAGNLTIKNEGAGALTIIGASGINPVITVLGNLEFPQTASVSDVTLGSATAASQVTIALAGNITILDDNNNINLFPHITFNGSGNQQIGVGPAVLFDASHVQVLNGQWRNTKSSGTINLTSDFVIAGGFSVTTDNWDFAQTGKTLTINGAYSQSGGIVTAPSNMAVGSTFTLSGGTFNVSSALTVTGSYSQTAGVFNGASSNTNIGGAFTVSGGTFYAPAGMLTLGGAINLTGGAFNHNYGTVTLTATASCAITTAGAAFNNVVIDKISGTAATLTLNDGLIVEGRTGNKE